MTDTKATFNYIIDLLMPPERQLRIAQRLNYFVLSHRLNCRSACVYQQTAGGAPSKRRLTFEL